MKGRDGKLVLCGGSILDTGAYVAPSGRAVESHLRRLEVERPRDPSFE